VCLGGAICGLTCRFVIIRMAGGGQRLPHACGRWLPAAYMTSLMFECQERGANGEPRAALLIKGQKPATKIRKQMFWAMRGGIRRGDR